MSLEEARAINEEHRKLNGQLREENKLLKNMFIEIYDILSSVDFSMRIYNCSPYEYDELPWERWEVIFDAIHDDTLGTKPIQLQF